ncbi:MAG: 30S ribosome-binding factor RbfA [Firmicutes bacterium]|nr:30S ribosome-binding factor RbfA [Candidatus Fermentithermobacillaceae bacterium]HON86623.1 30S ribosome-binding factor RbfA [Bacillota bacterium]
MAQRPDRIAALIREVVSELIMRRLKDPRIGFASVVRVSVNKDLSQAKVYISVLGTEEEKEKTMEGLKSAQGLIRAEVSKALGIRHAPEIQFILDDSIEYSIHISKLLSEIEEDEKKDKDKEQPE